MGVALGALIGAKGLLLGALLASRRRGKRDVSELEKVDGALLNIEMVAALEPEECFKMVCCHRQAEQRRAGVQPAGGEGRYAAGAAVPLHPEVQGRRLLRSFQARYWQVRASLQVLPPRPSSPGNFPVNTEWLEN